MQAMQATLAERPQPPATQPADPTSPTLSPGQLLQANGSFALLGLAAAVGSGDASVALRCAPLVVVIALGSVLFTAPAMLVIHAYLGLRARPSQLVRAMAQGWIEAGRLALGLAPVTLFFALTSDLWGLALVMSGAWAGALGLSEAQEQLRRCEQGSQTGRRMGALAMGWALLTALVGLRLGSLLTGNLLGS